MIRKILLLMIVLVILLGGRNYLSAQERSDVHYHAGFRVYIDGAVQDYSGYQYMNFVPCSEHDSNKSPAEEQIEKAHLHDGVGEVVHVHRSGSTWGDLFRNIHVELPKDKVLSGYINGTKNEDIMNAPIKAYTTAIFLLGDTDENRGSELVSEERIKEVEAKSELCGS